MDASLPPTDAPLGMGVYADNLDVTSTAGFARGDLVLIRNNQSADMFEVTGTPSATTLNSTSADRRICTTA